MKIPKVESDNLYQNNESDETGIVELFLDNEWSNPIEHLNITSIDLNLRTNMIGSPVETGYTYFDNRVLEPTKIHVTGICNSCYFKDVFKILGELISNKEFSYCSISTKGSFYDNLMLVNWKQSESNEMYDAVRVELDFEEVLQESFEAETDESYRSTVNVGFINS